jgi:cysteine synthase
MINLKLNEEIIKKNAQRAKEKHIIYPTFKQMLNPNEYVPENIKKELTNIGLWDINPTNLFRITWKNNIENKNYGEVNYVEIPKEITGVKARIIGLVGKYFPTGAHKVGASYACLAPALVTGQFDAQRQKAVWPSTGNYCRGGAYNSNLLACDSIAILPEEMSQERFNWLKKVAGEVIATPGCESNVKEIYDKCHELNRTRGDDVFIFNQFDQLGNYLWHYEITGKSIEELLQKELKDNQKYFGLVSSTGSGGTIAAGDYLKQKYPYSKIAAAEALQCPTLYENGFGGHRIEGIGDKHVPWIHNVKNSDFIIAVDDNATINAMRLFNEKLGHEYLEKAGIKKDVINQLELLGISSIGNLIAAIKLAKYHELTEDDVIVTIFTDSMEMYESRMKEENEKQGPYNLTRAEVDHNRWIFEQGISHVLELTYQQRRRIHNLKYYTWIEQQGKELEELNRQWYDDNYWLNIQKQVPEIDKLIEEFNKLSK